MSVIPPTVPIDQRVYLSVDWRGFEQFLKLRGDASGTRITYLGGRLEIMSPSDSHESIKTRIARLLEIWALDAEVELDGYGSWTVKSRELNVGAEADECYLVGSREAGKKPDLAIEVNWSTGGLDKLEVWRLLGVPEVWVWEDGRLRVFRLNVAGAYSPSKRSKLLPALDLELLARFVGERNQLAAIKRFRAAVRAKRRAP
jgi:Uma2 family endonuclease